MGLLSFSKVRIGVTKGTAVSILGEKSEDALLSATPHGEIVTFDHGVVPVVRDGMEVEVEGLPREKSLVGNLRMPGGQEIGCLEVTNPRRVFGEVALFWDGVETREECDPLVGDQGHDVTFPFQGPELEGETRAQGVGCGDHLGSRQTRCLGDLVDMKAYKVRDKKEQPAARGQKMTRRHREAPGIGHRFDGGTEEARPFLVEAAWESGKSFFPEYFANCCGTQGKILLLESLADLIDGVILLSQSHDEIARRRLLGLVSRSRARRDKERRFGITAELMAKDSKGSLGIPKGSRHFMGRAPFDKIGSERLVLALLGKLWFQEEPPDSCYTIWCSVCYNNTLLHSYPSVKANCVGKTNYAESPLF